MGRAFVFFQLVLAVLAAGSTSSEIVLFPDGAPGEIDGWPGPEACIQDCDGVRTDGMEITNVSVPTLTPFLNVSHPFGPSVVIAPGGGYSILAMQKEGFDVAERMNTLGVNAFVLKYRVPAREANEFGFGTAQLQDAQRAVGYVRAHAEEFGIDPDKIGVAGFSAGGHLTAHISTTWQTRAYDHVDEADDVSCRPDFSLLVYPWSVMDGNAAENAGTLAAEIAVDDTTPPAALFHASDDGTAPWQNSYTYFEALQGSMDNAAGARMGVYPSGGHGFGMCQFPSSPSNQEVCEWPASAAFWLHNLFGGSQE